MIGRRVQGEGPLDAEIMAIGEYPGKSEALTGRPFSGAVGREIDRFFDGVRLPSRWQVFLTTWIREWNGEDGEATAADFHRDEPALCEEITRVQPRVIVALGRHIVRWFLGDVDLEDTHAFQWYLPADSPRRALFQQPDRVVIHVGYNPAAGFRSPELSSAVAYDFAQLEAFLNGEIQARALYDDAYPEPVYVEITDVSTLDHVLGGDQPVDVEFASDTEGHPHRPWSVQLSAEPGTAWIIRRPELIARFATRVNEAPARYRFTFHSALHDLGMFRAFGIDVRDLVFDDTAIMTYNLQLEPPGLKPLCVRFNGMQMQSYDEIMGNVSNEIAQDWLLSCTGVEELEWEERRQAEFDRLTTTPYTDAKGRVKPGRKLRTLPKLPKTALHKALERCLRSAEPRKLWEKQTLDHQVAADVKYGAMWEATLDHVDLAKALHYAGRDADGTKRLAPKLYERLVANDLVDVYEADLGTVLLIDRMQQIGIKPDLAHFQRLGEDLHNEIAEIHTRLALRLVDAGAFDATSAFEFNPNSTYQVGDLLFQHFALPVLKETRDGDPSTNDKILEALQKQPGLDPVARDIIVDIREYREVYKLKHTFCVAPATRVLTEDLRWVAAGSLVEGDRLLGFDEHPSNTTGQHRYWRPATVTSCAVKKRPCYRLHFDDGTEVVCSTDHKWLARSASAYDKVQWVPADKLLASDRPRARFDYEVIKPLDVWSGREDYLAGYLAGSFDSEGCFQRPSSGVRLSYAQNIGEVLAFVDQCLRAEGFDPSVDIPSKGAAHLHIARADAVIRFLGEFRPLRLLPKFVTTVRENPPRVKLSRTVRIVKREYIGEQDVIVLSTDTRTFIAEGLASHNCDKMPSYVDRWPRDGRIHATFRITRTLTGRLAASDPNLLAMPKHGKFAERFRAGFVCDEGHYLGSWDLSQIELRVLAHLSQDPVLLAAYRDGLDLHARLAQRIFGGDEKDHKKGITRLAAKAINFGLPMGMTNIGLCVELKKNGVDVNEDDAQRWLDETMALYRYVPIYQQEKIAEARRRGFVTDIRRRRFYLGGIRSSHKATRAEAERQAGALPIQASAQECMKLAEAAIWDMIKRRQRAGQWVEPILQIHDDMILEFAQPLVHEIDADMRACMTQVPAHLLSVPIETSGDYGVCWGDMHEITKDAKAA